METFFSEMGSMGFLMLITGACGLGWSIAFSYRPGEKKLRVSTAFMRATLLAGIFGCTAGLVNTLRAVQSTFEGGGDTWWQILIIGARESGNNLFLCFAFLSLAALFVAVGEARWRHE